MWGTLVYSDVSEQCTTKHGDPDCIMCVCVYVCQRDRMNPGLSGASGPFIPVSQSAACTLVSDVCVFDFESLNHLNDSKVSKG